MDVREAALSVFPVKRAAKNTIYQLASAMWSRYQADKIRHVSSWIELLDLPIGEIGPTGIGVLLTFMETDMAAAYLPAWLVLGYEYSFSYAGVLPAVIVALDDQTER